MSILTLIRHGQATAFQKESDRLSEAGEEQARRLAAFWIRNAVDFDEVYTGTLARQKGTERIVAAAFDAAGLRWPVPAALPSFDEYDATGVLSAIVPMLATRDHRFAALVQTFESTRENRDFQRIFEVAMRQWGRGELEAPGVETWPVFRGRVLEGLQRVMLSSVTRRIAVFTSGGPIGLAVQCAMKAPDGVFLDVHWRIRNCSLTEFVFSGGRFTLDSFNAVPHLDATTLWTYR